MLATRAVLAAALPSTYILQLIAYPASCRDDGTEVNTMLHNGRYGSPMSGNGAYLVGSAEKPEPS